MERTVRLDENIIYRTTINVVGDEICFIYGHGTGAGFLFIMKPRGRGVRLSKSIAYKSKRVLLWIYDTNLGIKDYSLTIIG